MEIEPKSTKKLIKKLKTRYLESAMKEDILWGLHSKDNTKKLKKK